MIYRDPIRSVLSRLLTLDILIGHLKGDMERMRARPGKTVLEGENIEIQSRDSGRTIPCRVVLPKAGRTSVTGVFLHFHGGGLCEGGHDELVSFVNSILL
jgi:acetyl esterase/lipase